MKCTKCGNPFSHVIKTWYDDDDYRNSVIRRRECMKCKNKFVTHEELGDFIEPQVNYR